MLVAALRYLQRPPADDDDMGAFDAFPAAARHLVIVISKVEHQLYRSVGNE